MFILTLNFHLFSVHFYFLVTWVRQQGAEKAGGLLFCVSKNLPASQKCWGESGREVCVLLGNLPLLHLLGQVEGSEKMD